MALRLALVLAAVLTVRCSALYGPAFGEGFAPVACEPVWSEPA